MACSTNEQHGENDDLDLDLEFEVILWHHYYREHGALDLEVNFDGNV